MSDERSAGEIDRTLGGRVRARRLEIGMSQEKLAERLGITFQQVQKYEKGVNRIAAARLIDIANALEAPLARFFDGLTGRHDDRSGRKGRRTLDQALANADAIDLVMTFDGVANGKVRRRILELVRAMADTEV